ncbi:hypothetical protein QN379_11595 [Glaciimonas sp. Gout2]|uniref:hypothetical protein n=2 Tax=Glaciimonas TaxID=1229970 RepID=UPI002AB51A44|nr:MULTISPECIES: hypothetical protein [unclassified Glaciimonas]MDY7548768.1 hypothetical protein [Glaciimonas sp. CA11.2]MEB0012416.1 hypothetical protein [Glaciimonas sp. Cout2]MEB0082655.1 hypothetical protein [Glaciimonas sp. Gout2]
MDTSKEKFKQEDKKFLAQKVPTQTSSSGSTSHVEKDQSSPSATEDRLNSQHILHEVAVQADGTEDPGAGIEQMVESKVESGSSLQPSSTPAIDPAALSPKRNPGPD